jgi:cell wall-associated NlpC family hydrolase
VAAIENQVAALDAEVERAAEAYNGARYHLSIVHARIRSNQRALAITTRDLGRSRDTLAKRLVAIYKQGEPTLADVLLSSDGISVAADRINTMKRISRLDARVVTQVHDLRGRQVEQRLALVSEQRKARKHLRAIAIYRQRVNGLLVERANVLRSVRGELAQMIAAEQARQEAIARARAAALAAQIQQQQQLQAAAAAQSQSSGSPTAVAQSAGTPQSSGAPSSLVPSTSSSGTAYAPVGSVGSNSGNAAAVGIAEKYLGTPYVWGGASPSGFDCSGLVSYVYSKLGKDVPHYTGAIASKYQTVDPSQMEPGDLVLRSGLGHVGIYIGGGKMIHSPHTGDVVKISDVGSVDKVVRP